MKKEIWRIILTLAPELIFLIGLCLLMVIVWNIARFVTIRHYLKHHMKDMVAAKMKEQTTYIEMLDAEYPDK